MQRGIIKEVIQDDNGNYNVTILGHNEETYYGQWDMIRNDVIKNPGVEVEFEGIDYPWAKNCAQYISPYICSSKLSEIVLGYEDDYFEYLNSEEITEAEATADQENYLDFYTFVTGNIQLFQDEIDYNSEEHTPETLENFGELVQYLSHFEFYFESLSPEYRRVA